MPIINDKLYNINVNIKFQISSIRSLKSMRNNNNRSQIDKRDYSQPKKTARKIGSSLKNRNSKANENHYFTPIKKPTLFNQNYEFVNPETIKKHYSGK